MAKTQSLSPRQFFNSLDLSEMDSDVAEYIRSEIIPDERLELLDKDNEEFELVKEFILQSYPKSEEKGTVEKKEEKSTEPVKMSKQMLMTRLKLVKKMLEKQPNNTILNTRIKIIESMIKKAE